MPEGKEPIIGVFDIEIIIIPGSVEPSRCGPEGVNEIEDGIFFLCKADLQSVERMERHCGGEKIGDRGTGEGEKSTAGVQ